MIEVSKSIGFLLAKAYQRGCALYKEQFEAYDLTPQQVGLLRFLWEEDSITQVELSSRSLIDRTTIGGLIDRLQQMGFLQRLPHPEDRRAHLICLTDTGKRLKDELTPLCAELSRKILAPLTLEEADTLMTILKKISNIRQT
jgi:DNA-binding MarR family transcriptional regulator